MLSKKKKSKYAPGPTFPPEKSTANTPKRTLNAHDYNGGASAAAGGGGGTRGGENDKN